MSNNKVKQSEASKADKEDVKTPSKPVEEKRETKATYDPQAPNALKEAAKKKENDKAAKAPEVLTYVVLKTQMVAGEWKSPADKGEAPVTVELLAVQAHYRVLNGKLKLLETKAN